MKKEIKITKGELKHTGINEVDIDLIVKKWNHLWILTEWTRDNSWRVVKYVRKDSPMTQIKITISWKQANEIAEKLLLRPYHIMGSGYTWRKPSDSLLLAKWRRLKRLKNSFRN